MKKRFPFVYNLMFNKWKSNEMKLYTIFVKAEGDDDKAIYSTSIFTYL